MADRPTCDSLNDVLELHIRRWRYWDSSGRCGGRERTTPLLVLLLLKRHLVLLHLAHGVLLECHHLAGLHAAELHVGAGHHLLLLLLLKRLLELGIRPHGSPHSLREIASVGSAPSVTDPLLCVSPGTSCPLWRAEPNLHRFHAKPEALGSTGKETDRRVCHLP